MKKLLLAGLMLTATYGAGCTLFQKSARTTFPEQPNQVDSKPTATTTAITALPATSTSSASAFIKDGQTWQTYHNEIIGFEISYPSGNSADPTLNGVDLPQAVGEKNRWIDSIDLNYAGTDPETCALETQEGVRSSSKIITINSMPFCLQASYDAGGMMQEEDAYTYSTRVGRNTVSITFKIHHVTNPSVYGDCSEDPAEAEKNGWKTKTCIERAFVESRDTQLFNDIMNTFKLSEMQAEYTIAPKNEKRTHGLYDIDVEYPVMAGFKDAKIQDAFNLTMSQDMASSVKAFVDYFDGIDQEEFAKIWHGDYSFAFSTAKHGRYLSVVLNGGEYTGGAHPMQIYRTYVFDTADGKFLALEDLFKPKTSFLEKLSAFSYGEIVKRNVGEPKWNKTGTEPKAENFKYFWLDGKGLNIIFTPYQVASYVEGEQDVFIPYESLADIMLPSVIRGN